MGPDCNHLTSYGVVQARAAGATLWLGRATAGGKLVDPVWRNATNIAGTSFADGQSRTVHKGDVMYVPPGTPHQIADVKATLTMVITMLPNP